MKRFLMKGLVLVILVALIAGAAFAAGTREKAGAADVLTISVPWAGQELEQFLPVVRAFEQREGVQVRYLTYRGEDLSSVLPAQFQARQALADVIFMWDWWVGQNAQHAADLSDVWKQHEAAMIPSPLRVQNRTLAVPYVMVAKPGFWYRKSFFQRNNLSEPRNWDEFTALLRRIAAVPGVRNPIVSGNGVGWPISDVTEHFLVTFGGPDLNRGLMEGRIQWTDPRVRAVFQERIVPLLQARSFSDPVEWTQAVELWWGGSYGLYFMGNWITGMVADPNDLGVFPLPGARAVVTGPDWAFVPQYSPNVELAKRFVSFMLSQEGQTLRAREGGKLVIRKDVPATAYPAADQAVANLVARLETTVPDLDDTIGGDWQRVFWDQLKLLWVDPAALNSVLNRLQSDMPRR